MSHYTVMVRITAERLSAAGSVEDALREILAPYEESPKIGSPYLVFQSREDEVSKEWETGTVTMVRCPDGSLVSRSDERFRVPGSLGIGSDTHKVPDDHVLVEVPLKERFASRDELAKDWCGYRKYLQPDGSEQYGVYRNPNAKWDWYSIGGRWMGFFPIKAGVRARLGRAGAFKNRADRQTSDVVRIGDIDWERVDRQQAEHEAGFWTEYDELVAGKRFDVFDGPRSRAMQIGILRVEQDPSAPVGADEVAGKEWGIENPGMAERGDSRARWRDIYKVVPASERAAYSAAFFPLSTYAALDDAGWHAPGEMGWFGCSSDEPDSYLAYMREFKSKFIDAASSTDTLVLVDCHI